MKNEQINRLSAKSNSRNKVASVKAAKSGHKRSRNEPLKGKRWSVV